MNEAHKFSCLSRVPIFMNLSSDEKEHMHSFLRPTRFNKGDYVLHAGMSEPKLFVLNRGAAKIIRANNNGSEQIMRLLAPGDYVGELAVFTGRATECDVVATDDSTFCVLDKKHLRELIAKKPELAIHLLADMSMRLEKTEAYAGSLGTDTASNRLYELLVELSAGRKTFSLPVSKKDIAARIGVAPETLSRILKKLESNKQISVENKVISIL